MCDGNKAIKSESAKFTASWSSADTGCPGFLAIFGFSLQHFSLMVVFTFERLERIVMLSLRSSLYGHASCDLVTSTLCNECQLFLDITTRLLYS